MKKISKILKITGIIAVAVGLVLGFIDLKGYLKDKERIEILNWVLNSPSGMSIELPAAKEFMKKFPPPPDEDINNITHLTKSKMSYAIGGTINANVNYMRKDHSRTSQVTTLAEIRAWANESSYPWIAWWLTLIGLIELIGNWYIEKRMENT